MRITIRCSYNLHLIKILMEYLNDYSLVKITQIMLLNFKYEDFTLEVKIYYLNFMFITLNYFIMLSDFN